MLLLLVVLCFCGVAKGEKVSCYGNLKFYFHGNIGRVLFCVVMDKLEGVAIAIF